MKNSKRGEIATILTVGTLIVLGVSTLVSSLFLSKNNSQTTNTRAADTVYRGPCLAQPPIESKDTPSGYHWEADCNKQCNDKSACPQNSSDGRVNPATSNWCYGFDGPNHSTADWRCMQLKWGASNFSQVPTNTATPVQAPINTATPMPGNTGGGTTGNQCSPTKVSKQNACDPACCGNNGECPSGQACNIGNENCNSGLSCGVASSGGGNTGGGTGGTSGGTGSGIACEYPNKAACNQDSDCATCSAEGCSGTTFKCMQRRASGGGSQGVRCEYPNNSVCMSDNNCTSCSSDGCSGGTYKCTQQAQTGGGSLGNCRISDTLTIPNGQRACSADGFEILTCVNGTITNRGQCTSGCDVNDKVCRVGSPGGSSNTCPIKTANKRECTGDGKHYNFCQSDGKVVSQACEGNKVCNNGNCVEPEVVNSCTTDKFQVGRLSCPNLQGFSESCENGGTRFYQTTCGATNTSTCNFKCKTIDNYLYDRINYTGSCGGSDTCLFPQMSGVTRVEARIKLNVENCYRADFYKLKMIEIIDPSTRPVAVYKRDTYAHEPLSEGGLQKELTFTVYKYPSSTINLVVRATLYFPDLEYYGVTSGGSSVFTRNEAQYADFQITYKCSE